MTEPDSKDLQRARHIIDRIFDAFSQRVVGQEQLAQSLLTTLIADGHILLESVPGLAKTTAAQTLATSVEGSFRRIQCTPDLMPNDIVGTQIYNMQTGQMTTQLGPVHANFVLLDEINRSSAKTQSAMLEAMQERQTTIGGVVHKLPTPFMVIATQNPIEEEGTYVLPEAQMDRFLLKEILTYPSPSDELSIVTNTLQGRYDSHLGGSSGAGREGQAGSGAATESISKRADAVAAAHPGQQPATGGAAGGAGLSTQGDFSGPAQLQGDAQQGGFGSGGSGGSGAGQVGGQGAGQGTAPQASSHRSPGPVASLDDVRFLREQRKRIYIHPALAAYIVDIVNTTRGRGPNPIPGWNMLVRVGGSPRASLALAMCAQALALIRGRNYVTPDDIKDLRYRVLRHRIIRTYDALADNVSAESLIDQVFAQVAVP